MRAVRMAYSYPAAGNAPTHLGVSEGYFADEGLDVDLIRVPRGSDGIRMVELGNALCCTASGMPVLKAAMRGSKPLIIMSIEAENVFAIMGAKGIESPTDLKGGSVGVSGAEDQDGIMMQRGLRDWGLDPYSDVQMRVFDEGRGAIWKALLEGKVLAQACTIPEPLYARELGLPIMRDFLDEREPYQSGSLVVRNDVAREEPELVQGFMRAQLRSIKRFNDDFDASIEPLRNCTGIDNVSVLRTTNQLFGEAMLDFIPRKPPLQNVIRDVRDITGSSVNVSVDDIIDPTFAQAIAAN